MTNFVPAGRLQPYLRRLLAVAACVFPFAASAGSYTYTTIAVPGAYTTYAIGLSEDGTLLGGYQDSQGIHGFTYAKGKIRKLDVPNAAYTQPGGINKHGEIVGTYELACPNCQNQGFIYAKGKFTTYAVPGNFDTQLFGVNDSGDIAGTTYTDDPTQQTAFTLSATGQLTLITAATAPANVAAINDRGSVIGTDAQSAFLYHKGIVSAVTIQGAVLPPFLTGINRSGTLTGSYINSNAAIVSFTLAGAKLSPVAVPGMTATFASAINNGGTVVGSAYGSDDTALTGFADTAGAFVLVAVPGANSTQAHAINKAGQIAGSFVAADGSEQAFLATPGA